MDHAFLKKECPIHNKARFLKLEKKYAGMGTLLLDLDNTLYDAKYAYSYSIHQLDEEWNRRNYYGNFLAEYENARARVKKNLKGHSSNRLRILCFKHVFYELDDKLIPEKILEWDNLYFHHFTQAIKNCLTRHKVFYKELYELLYRISKKHPILIVTNENIRTQLIKLQLLLPPHLSVGLLTSEEIGIEKPAKPFFKEALFRTKSKAKDCVMVGDSIEDDIKGAIQSGIKAVHVKNLFGEREHSLQKKISSKVYTETDNILTAIESTGLV